MSIFLKSDVTKPHWDAMQEYIDSGESPLVWWGYQELWMTGTVTITLTFKTKEKQAIFATAFLIASEGFVALEQMTSSSEATSHHIDFSRARGWAINNTQFAEHIIQLLDMIKNALVEAEDK